MDSIYLLFCLFPSIIPALPYFGFIFFTFILMPQTSTHWDSNLFSDRERQEKFNKLMVIPSRCVILKYNTDLNSAEQQHIYPITLRCTNTFLESEDALA